ncbi:hypothetical protein KQI84_14360 [bacterium]|nr:hypothetical protein [bacterium]
MDTPQIQYDCDTSSYRCTEKEYHDRSRSFGSFIENGKAYQITDRDTPRPWLNYLCNEKFAACVSNIGLGFTWLHSSLLRVTKYEHEIDYLPREFQDGREILLRDEESGQEWQAFRDAENVECIHRPGMTELQATHNGVRVHMQLFVPSEDCGECWCLSIENTGSATRRLRLRLEQTWTFARFGIHTAEEGIPYLSTPGEGVQAACEGSAVTARVDNPDLPLPLYGVFVSAEDLQAECIDQVEKRKDGRTFVFNLCRLGGQLELGGGEAATFHVFAGADSTEGFIEGIRSKYSDPSTFTSERERVLEERRLLEERIACTLPDKNIEAFLNVWLKNQLFLTFRFVRSGFFGFRDTLQDTWGYSLLDPAMAKRFLLRTLAHVCGDGVCPRNYSIVDDQHDLRAFMDSGSWIAMALVDYIKETGDVEVLDERIPWLDSDDKTPLIDHVWAAMELLYKNRGRYGLCLTGDGDWNDALEGIGKSGDAVSAWLTMAVFHAQNLMAELFDHIGATERAQVMKTRSAELRECLEHAWDGQWYVYGFTGSGAPIGSHKNREGRIHLNAQTWAMFTGLANEERIDSMRAAIREQLETPYGPALLAPPYVDEADEVGRIARLEPGTFENGSIYQHAVAFAIYADFIAGDGDAGADLFSRLLPTNPENFDARRTSEPYCTGNYYCGPSHPRCGQNFFTWFTGNAAWLLRAGFDRMLGLQADFDGLHVRPCVPRDWDRFSARRTFRGQVYELRYERTDDTPSLELDGRRLPNMTLPAPDRITAKVRQVLVKY